jgi:hypothetical protein
MPLRFCGGIWTLLARSKLARKRKKNKRRIIASSLKHIYKKVATPTRNRVARRVHLNLGEHFVSRLPCFADHYLRTRARRHHSRMPVVARYIAALLPTHCCGLTRLTFLKFVAYIVLYCILVHFINEFSQQLLKTFHDHTSHSGRLMFTSKSMPIIVLLCNNIQR